MFPSRAGDPSRSGEPTDTGTSPVTGGRSGDPARPDPATGPTRDPWLEDDPADLAERLPARHAETVEDVKLADETSRIAAARRAKTQPDVPVDRRLSLAVAAFAVLLTGGLILGVYTAGLGMGRISFAIVILGVQFLFVLASAMAMRPPALPAVFGVSMLVAAGADLAAVLSREASLTAVSLVAAGGFGLAVLAQLMRRTDRQRVTESLAATLMIVIGVVAFATMIVLTRVPAGAQSLMICLASVGAALVAARLLDTVVSSPRMAPQVPRGVVGVIVGAMVGTLVGAVGGAFVVEPFTPARGAILGLLCACSAVLADLAANYAEAGRRMAGDAPTMWIARHMQGPIGAFALAAPVAYLANAIMVLPNV
ncbi:hypothetical protein [Pilimelia columellifera]|uniref:Uncharacterized protein n=1 Tax=Pilimelia columellifera subsp. columellifera TaxID=706583 RepID=A0ABN3NG51_9ACTN